MVQGIDRRQQESDESVLQSSSSGGLNTMSSSLSIPLQDSPDLENVEVNQRGNLRKRRGTQTIAIVNENASNGASGAQMETVKLRNLPSLVLVKFNLTLSVFSFTEGTTRNFREILSFGNAISFTNVFSERARYVKPDTIQTSEFEPRIILTTGVNPPVQVKFVQSISFDVTYDSTNNESDIVFQNANLKQANVDQNIFVFQDGTDITEELVSTSFDNSTNELTVTVNGDRRNSEMSVVHTSWQWWAEASAVRGNRLYQRKSRFNSKDLDKFVELPSEVLSGLQPLEGAGVSLERPRYPLIPTQSNSYGTYGNPNTAPFYDYKLAPSQADEYLFSQPGQFDLNVDPEVREGLGVVAFGDIRRDSNGNPTDEIEPLHFHRGLPVKFNGGRGVKSPNLRVVVGESIYLQNLNKTSADARTYYLKENADTYFTDPITTNDVRGQFIDFTATPTTGVSFTTLIKAIHRTPKFLGSDAKFTENPYGAGNFVPAFGLWEFCDYQEGSFPRTVSIIQGRLVFGGTPKQPLRVAVSEVFDSLEPGNNFRDFQTLLSEGNPDEAFQFDVQAGLNDKITAMQEFNNSLFIFTQSSTFRLTGGDAGLSPGNFFLQFQVGVGCVNSRCVERIENTMYFMNQNGVFDISGTADASQYASAERSLKVRDEFDQNEFDEESAWMMYDSRNSELFVGVSSNQETLEENNPWTAEKLLIYNVFRNAWTRYTDYSGRLYNITGTVVRKSNEDTAPLIYHTNFSTIDPNGSPIKCLISVMNEFRPVDYLEFRTLPSDQSPGWSETLDNAVAKQVTYQLEKARYFYPVDQDNASVDKDKLFSLLPHREIEDVKVEISYDNGSSYQRLTFNEDFVKFRNGAFENGIYLTSIVPDSGKQIRITKLSQPEDDGWTGDIHPVRAWLDNKLLVENTDYTVDIVNNQYVFTFNFEASKDAVLEMGVTYDAYYFSPKFFRANMGSDKRFVHWYGYFYNEPYNEIYDSTDANPFSGQDPSEISETYKTPVGFNLVFNFNDTGAGYTSDSDIYGTLDLFWDTGLFDVGSPVSQFNQYSRVSEPIIGASYNFQVGLLCNRATYWEQVGYQVTLLQRGNTQNKPNNSAQNFQF